jgi:membrane-associated phospholipid phosphatase
MTQSWLLPQAYPEGSPMHPSYPAGHAVIAGACATVLKAFFDESFPIEEPVIPTVDGLRLTPLSGAALTVGGEINKLASNISVGRNIAGVHWRSDALEGLRLGEEVAIAVLRAEKPCFSESHRGFELTTFDGKLITV